MIVIWLIWPIPLPPHRHCTWCTTGILMLFVFLLHPSPCHLDFSAQHRPLVPQEPQPPPSPQIIAGHPGSSASYPSAHLLFCQLGPGFTSVTKRRNKGGSSPRWIVARPRAAPIPRPRIALGPTRLNLTCQLYVRRALVEWAAYIGALARRSGTMTNRIWVVSIQVSCRCEDKMKTAGS